MNTNPRLSAERWKVLRQDILWCSLPECDAGHSLVAWPNMQISQQIADECHRAFDGCIIERSHATRFHGCVLNLKTQQVDGIFEVHDDDATKTFFMSARVADPTDYDEAASIRWLQQRLGGQHSVFGYAS